jgi:predicted ATPase
VAHPARGGLTFTPTLEDFAKERAGSPVTVLSGGNNSGKSLVLKWLKQTMGKTAYMVGANRFYHVYHFSAALRDPNELDQFESQFQSHFWSEQYNYEQNYIDLNRIILGLSDSQRSWLFELCGRLIDSSFSLQRVQPDNELSVRYIDVGGQNLSVASTGTRLLMTILGICMDDRFKTLLIDEPELGLSPRVQSSLAAFLQDPVERPKYFPHLKQVVLATHSQLFLHRNELTSNYVVSKEVSHIALSRVQNVGDFHRLQFNLLGNSLEGLFFPSSIVYVEGETDQQYLERVCALRFAGRNVVVVRSGGDPKQKLHSLRETLGDLQKSPLRDRLFVVVDSVHAKGLQTELVQMGLLSENFVVWDHNGIEYVYPSQVMTRVFCCGAEQLPTVTFKEDVVSLNGIEMRKRELCQEVVRSLDTTTVFPAELETKLLERILNAIG